MAALFFRMIAVAVNKADGAVAALVNLVTLMLKLGIADTFGLACGDLMLARLLSRA